MLRARARDQWEIWMTCFDKTKPMPKWMQRGHECEGYERGKRYYRKIWQQQPIWANVGAIRRIYAEARRRRRAGDVVHVDHIFPLRGDLCSGLHVHTNLHIVPAGDNIRKSNSVPGQGQLDMFLPDWYELEMQ